MTEIKTTASLLDRTIGNLRRAWRAVAGTEYDARAASLQPDLPDDDVEQLRQQMRASLERRGGEVSARARAAALGHVYLALNATGRERFMRVLATDFDVDSAAVDAAVAAYSEAPPGPDRRGAQRALKQVLDAPRVTLLTHFNELPEGVKFLVDMRADLMPLARQDASLAALEDDLRALLAAWFDVGFLELRRITWSSTPAALLEKLIAYEAVHAIRGWDDLKNRLDSDRRCFAYFHPRMPDEPLIFVEVALVEGMAGNVQDLLDENAPVIDPSKADTAIFYSISNAQKGLAGISFGNHLIKRVVASLSQEFKGVGTFATLSPVPGLMAWLAGLEEPGVAEALAAVARPDWHEDADAVEVTRPRLMRMAARYLLEEKGRDGQALDRVAHFHLHNGARIERLNWMGDRSPNGLAQSAGIMVNYVYRLGDIDDNHEAYVGQGRIAASAAVRALAKR